MIKIILGSVGAVLILFFLILIHEFGHYLMAKKNGVKVPEFAIGAPPKLFSFKKWGTTFFVNLIPILGYVKLHGEDSSDEKLLKDKGSFASKTPWQKIEIVLAGIVMNLLVFWICMTVALGTGIAPMMLTENDYKEVLAGGYYNVEPGLVVRTTVDGSVEQGDVLKEVDGVEVGRENFRELLEEKGVKDVVVNSSGKKRKVALGAMQLNELEFYPMTQIFGLKVLDVPEKSYFEGLLEEGDSIYAVDGVPVFDLNAFWTISYKLQEKDVTIKVVRAEEGLEVIVPRIKNSIFVDAVIPESKAEIAGVLPGDRLVSVNGKDILYSENFIEDVINKGAEEILYVLERMGETVELRITPEVDGTIGMYLAPQLQFSNLNLDFVPYNMVGSLIKVKDFRVDWYKAPFVAVGEGYKLAKATAKGFLSTVYGIFAKFTVSEEIGGPVQVMKMSYHFVNEGGIALIQFIGLLSLSLGIINLLPIPALDGGRFIFIIIEALRGKPVNPKIEGWIHTIGFILLMGLILVITMFDVIRL